MKEKIITRERASAVKLYANIIELIHRADTICLMRSDKYAIYGHTLCLSYEYDNSNTSDKVAKLGIAAMVGDWCLGHDKIVNFEEPSEGTLLMIVTNFSDIEVNELLGRIVPDPLAKLSDWESFIPASREGRYSA